MRRVAFLFLLLAFGFARANGEPVGSSSMSINPTTLVVNEEIQKDLNNIIGPVIPNEDRNWKELVSIKSLTETVPALRQEIF